MGVLSRLKPRLEEGLQGLVKALASMHGNPNTYTLAGAVLSIASPLSVAAGQPLLAPVLAALGALMDALDGMVARAAGRASRKGSLLDSVLDRVSDSAYSVALLLLGVEPLAVLLAATGSLLVPYVRAKAESLGVELAGRGLLERPERTLLYLAALTLAALGYEAASVAATALIALLAWVTAAQRLVIAWRAAGGS